MNHVWIVYRDDYGYDCGAAVVVHSVHLTAEEAVEASHATDGYEIRVRRVPIGSDLQDLARKGWPD